MCMANIYVMKTTADASEPDTLLWCDLWEPLCLPRDVRHGFRGDGKELELAAREKRIVEKSIHHDHET